MKKTKVHVLTMGKVLYYAARDYEDAEYEKKTAEEENWQGRTQNIKLTPVEIDETDVDSKVPLKNGVEYTVGDIMNIL